MRSRADAPALLASPRRALANQPPPPSPLGLNLYARLPSLICGVGARQYYWNTLTHAVTWDPPGTPEGCQATPAASRPPESRKVAAPRAVLAEAASRRHDVASLVFRKYNVSKSGILADAELRALCHEMEHAAASDGDFEHFKRLLDVNGDGTINKEEFLSWWREGESRWRWLSGDGDEAHRRRAQGLASFFDAFSPEAGALVGDSLARMHLCLVERGYTGKALHTFMRDVDPEGDGRLTLHKLHRWYASSAIHARRDCFGARSSSRNSPTATHASHSLRWRGEARVARVRAPATLPAAPRPPPLTHARARPSRAYPRQQVLS